VVKAELLKRPDQVVSEAIAAQLIRIVMKTDRDNHVLLDVLKMEGGVLDGIRETLQMSEESLRRRHYLILKNGLDLIEIGSLVCHLSP
jgi:hypothetical protein